MTYEAPRNSFFTIAAPQYGPVSQNAVNLILPEDIEMLSVVEEMGKSVQGSLSLYDRDLVYPGILRNNANLLLSWGYKANGAPIDSMFGAGMADLYTQKLERRGINALVINPSGKAADTGDPHFSCGFISKGWFGSPVYATYTTGTKASVVNDALKRMGVLTVWIHFDNGIESYNSESVERQCETDFAFVARLSEEWRCIFRMGFAQDGTTYAIFCEFKYAGQAQTLLRSAVGLPAVIPSLSWRQYNDGDLMCTNYDWANQEGENGQGDNVRIAYINGKPVYQRFTIKGDTVVVQTLDAKAVDDYVERGGSMDAVLNAKSFQDPNIQQFWSSAKQTTAPNGLGYTINVHMLGNPLMTAGLLIALNKGFPSMLVLKDKAPIQFLIRKVTHSIGQQGYYTDLELVDLWTISAIGVH